MGATIISTSDIARRPPPWSSRSLLSGEGDGFRMYCPCRKQRATILRGGQAGTGGEQCPPSSEPIKARTSCRTCEVTSEVGYAGAGGVCHLCAHGSEPNEDLSACLPCGDGEFGNSDSVCGSFPAGTEVSDNRTLRLDCADRGDNLWSSDGSTCDRGYEVDAGAPGLHTSRMLITTCKAVNYRVVLTQLVTF